MPEPGEVWLDSRMFPALGLALGDEVEVGLARLGIGRVLIKEPDRGGSFFDLGPRLLMNIADVPATEVVQPGSRIGYRLLLRGPEAELEALRAELELEPNYRWMDIRRNSARIGGALDRAESFPAARRFFLACCWRALPWPCPRTAMPAATTITLASSRRWGRLPTRYSTPISASWAWWEGSACCSGSGWAPGCTWRSFAALDALIPVDLPCRASGPSCSGAATGLICALAFAMPPLLHLKNVSHATRHAA